jgi:hypothetical protein
MLVSWGERWHGQQQRERERVEGTRAVAKGGALPVHDSRPPTQIIDLAGLFE